MKYIIKNPKEDYNDNCKENIFLAYDEDGNDIGCAYVYPAINHYQTYDYPFRLYFDVQVGMEVDDICDDTLREELYQCVLNRAKLIRKEKPDLKAKFYTGFVYDAEMMECLMKKGFDEDCTVVMRNDDIMKDCYTLSDAFKVREMSLKTSEEIDAYKTLYDQIFIRPLDKELLAEAKNTVGFRCVEVLKSNEVIASCTLSIEDGIGYIDTMYVMPKHLGFSYGKVIMAVALDYFSQQKVSAVELEVWRSNERAVKLYESFGFTEVARNIMFPALEI